jgi:hypothetical protein
MKSAIRVYVVESLCTAPQNYAERFRPSARHRFLVS